MKNNFKFHSAHYNNEVYKMINGHKSEEKALAAAKAFVNFFDKNSATKNEQYYILKHFAETGCKYMEE